MNTDLRIIYKIVKLFETCVNLVAFGRELHLGLIYPCLLGARMLGSTVFPWLISEPSVLRTEDFLVYSFIIMGLVLSIVAYDYQVHILYLWNYKKYIFLLWLWC